MKNQNIIFKKETIDFVGVNNLFTSVGGRIPNSTTGNIIVKNNRNNI